MPGQACPRRCSPCWSPACACGSGASCVPDPRMRCRSSSANLWSRERRQIMAQQVQPQLAHCGIYARDVGRLATFYTEVLGLVVADRGISQRTQTELAFLTASPSQHHQLVIMTGRAPQGASTVNQLSFKVADLDQLKAVLARVRASGVDAVRQVSHGNALSIYFADPEDNGIEVYIDTPWYVPQPHGVPIDLTRPNQEILAETERHCRATPGFMPLDQWEAEVARRLASGKAAA